MFIAVLLFVETRSIGSNWRMSPTRAAHAHESSMTLATGEVSTTILSIWGCVAGLAWFGISDFTYHNLSMVYV